MPKTPTTDQVRTAAVFGLELRTWPNAPRQEPTHAFDTWYQDALAGAWAEGYAAGKAPTYRPNPYREPTP